MIKDSIKFKEEGAMMLMSLKIFVTKQHGKSREINAFRVCLVTRGPIPGLSGEEEGGDTQKWFHSKPERVGTIEKYGAKGSDKELERNYMVPLNLVISG